MVAVAGVMNRLKPKKGVRVTLDSGRSYDGVLLNRLRPWSRWVRLANVKVEVESGGFADAKGVCHLPASRVEFIQVHP